MTSAKLREFLRARPFRPFRIHLADGRALRVMHPELALVTPDDRTAVVIWPRSRLNLIDMPLVTRISRGTAAARRKKG